MSSTNLDKRASDDLETGVTENRDSPIEFRVSITGDASERDSVTPDPTVDTPMLPMGDGANGKVKYSLGDMEVVEVVSLIHLYDVYLKKRILIIGIDLLYSEYGNTHLPTTCYCYCLQNITRAFR